MSARALAAALVFAAALGSACTSTARRETGSLTEAVDRYRHTQGPAKDAAGQAVAAVPCTDARVCAAKQSCVAAIDPTTRSLALKDEVARSLSDIEQKHLAADSAEAQALPGKLDEAERLLKEGRTHMAECDAKLAELQATFGG